MHVSITMCFTECAWVWWMWWVVYVADMTVCLPQGLYEFIVPECVDVFVWGEVVKEGLFCLTTPLEYIDFHIIDYWKSNLWSL